MTDGYTSVYLGKAVSPLLSSPAAPCEASWAADEKPEISWK